jgi:hypothetical protein
MKIVKIALASGMLALSVAAAPLSAYALNTAAGTAYSDQDRSCQATIGTERFHGVCEINHSK